MGQNLINCARNNLANLNFHSSFFKQIWARYWMDFWRTFVPSALIGKGPLETIFNLKNHCGLEGSFLGQICVTPFMNVPPNYSIYTVDSTVLYTYFFLIPGVVCWALHDLEDDWCHEDNKDQNWSNESPGDLPVNPDLNSCHFTDVLKPISNTVTILFLFYF